MFKTVGFHIDTKVVTQYTIVVASISSIMAVLTNVNWDYWGLCYENFLWRGGNEWNSQSILR
jgi:hypothetical protein